NPLAVRFAHGARERTAFAARACPANARLCTARAASHPGHAIAPDGFVTLFTCQTARVSSFPRRVFAPGFCFLASRTLMKGWRSAERRTDACEAPVACSRRQAGN